MDRVRGKFSTKEYARKRVFKARSAIQRSKLGSFERELGALKRLRHHHLVQYVGSYTDSKWVAFMMLPIADSDLTSWMISNPPKKSLREAFGCLASAVSYLHQQSVRHKDIKSQNVLVYQGKVLLTDFGSALDWKDMDASTTGGTAESNYTRKYAAPEVLGGDKRNSSSDIFSLGCVFLELATSLFDHHLDELYQHCLSTGTKAVIFAENMCAVEAWVGKLKDMEITRADSKVLDMALKMLNLDKATLPTGLEIATIFGGLGTNYFCKVCCTDRVILDLERKNINAQEPSQRGVELCKADVRGNVAIFQSLAKITDDLGYAIVSDGIRATALDLAMENGNIDIVKSFLVHSRTKGFTPDMHRALFLAVGRNDTSGLDTLLDFGADVNAEDENGTSLLYTAMIQRNEPMVKNLLSRGAKLDHGEDSTKRTVIHEAVRADDAEILKTLINHHQLDIDATDVFGMTALHEAATSGDKRLVDTLLKSNANPNICNGKGDSPLISIVRNRHTHLIKPLILAGANTKLCDSQGEPPRCIAASMGATAVLEKLLDAGPSLGHLNAKEENPLHLAVDAKNEAIVEMLLRKRPRYLSKTEKESGMTPVHYAAYDGSTTILRKLLACDATLIRKKDLTGRTPLRCAVNECGLVSTVQLLLDRGPTMVNTPCAEGRTPLIMAAEHDLVGIARLLLKRGAKVDATNSANRTALHIAASKEGSGEMVKLLLANGANANLPDAHGYTALGAAAAAHRGSTMALLKWEGNADLDHCCQDGSTQLMRAVASGSLEEAALLLRIGADVDRKNGQGRTALFAAVEAGRLEAVRLLLDRNCDVEVMDAEHATALMLAASHGHADIVKVLIGADVSLEVETENGNTALSKVADRGRENVVKLLVDAGARTEVVDRDGLTPLFRAVCRGHRQTASILVRAGADLGSAKLIAKKSKVAGTNKAKKLLKELEAVRLEKTTHRKGSGGEK